MDKSDEAPSCECANLPDQAVTEMGTKREEAVFASFDEVKPYGDGRWWQYLAKCRVCSGHWLIAQDTRIYDNSYLHRLSADEAASILAKDQWPEVFESFEVLMKAGRAYGMVWQFDDYLASGLVASVIDIRRARPDISASEMAQLLSIDETQVKALIEAAKTDPYGQKQ